VEQLRQLVDAYRETINDLLRPSTGETEEDPRTDDMPWSHAPNAVRRRILPGRSEQPSLYADAGIWSLLFPASSSIRIVFWPTRTASTLI
jgi:hypothetical protein